MSKFTGHDTTYRKIRFKGAIRTMKPHYPEEPKIKFVKKAGQWCRTYFEQDSKGDMIQKQEWSMDKPEGEQL